MSAIAMLQREIATLRAALAKAREEVERLSRAVYLFTENTDNAAGKANALAFALLKRAEAAERARDEAVRERDEQARLRQIAEDAIPKGLAVGMEFVRAEAARERDEAVAALRDVADFGPFDFAQAVEWCWCGDADPVKEHQPYCLRARRVLAASTGERKSGPAEPDVPR